MGGKHSRHSDKREELSSNEPSNLKDTVDSIQRVPFSAQHDGLEAILVDEKGDVPLSSFSPHGSHNIPETVSQATRGNDDGIANSNRDWQNLNQATEMPTTSNINNEKPSYVKESLQDLERALDESHENNGNSRIRLPKDDNPVSYSVRAPLKDNHYLRYTQKSQKRVAYPACTLLNENGNADVRYPYSTNEEIAAEKLRQARRLDFFITRRSYSWKEPPKTHPTEFDKDLKEINLNTERVNCPNTNTNRKANVVGTKVQPMPSTKKMETRLDAKDVVPDRIGVELLQQNFTSTGATERTDCDVAKNDQRIGVTGNKTDKNTSSSTVHPGNPSISRNKSSCISSQNRRVTSDIKLENRNCQKEVPISGITNTLQTGVDIKNEKPATTTDSKEHSNLSTVKAPTTDGLQVSRRPSVTVSDCSAEKDAIPSCADLDKASGKSDVVANGKNVKTEQEIGARKGVRLQKIDNLKEHQDETQPLAGKAAVPKDQRFPLDRNADKEARADVKKTDVPKRCSFVQNESKDICQNGQTCSATAQTGTDQPIEDPVTQGTNPPKPACLPSQADGSYKIAQSFLEPTAVVKEEKVSGTLVTDDSLAVASSSTVQQCQPEDQKAAVPVATIQPFRCESKDAMDLNEKDEDKTVQNARDDDGIVETLQPQVVNQELQPQYEKQAKRRRRGKGARALDEILAANRAREEDERKAAELLKQNEDVPLTAEQKEEENKDCHRKNPGCANGNAQEDKGIDTADAQNRANEQKERVKARGIRKCAANFVKNGSRRKILKAKRVFTLSKDQRQTLMNITFCQTCGDTKQPNGQQPFPCPKCKAVYYCTRACQHKDSKAHKKSCAGQKQKKVLCKHV